jgi:hypothetical protein
LVIEGVDVEGVAEGVERDSRGFAAGLLWLSMVLERGRER